MEDSLKQDVGSLCQIAYIGCMHGDVLYARKIFEALLDYNPDMTVAKIGMAYSHLVVDEFSEGDAILQELDQDDDDVLSMQAASKVLQKDETEARYYYDRVKDKSSPSARFAEQMLATL